MCWRSAQRGLRANEVEGQAVNLPNRLTLLRIALVPVFIVFASVHGIPFGYLLAAAVFTLASVTDYLDGQIARKRDMVTDFGKFADPLADKILTTVAFVYMLVDGVCHPLVLAVIVVREFAVSGVRMVAAGAKDGKVIAANWWGKVKTAVQMVTILAYYWVAGLMEALRPWIGPAPGWAYLLWAVTHALCWAVAAITALSGIQTIWANRAFIKTMR